MCWSAEKFLGRQRRGEKKVRNEENVHAENIVDAEYEMKEA